MIEGPGWLFGAIGERIDAGSSVNELAIRRAQKDGAAEFVKCPCGGVWLRADVVIERDKSGNPKVTGFGSEMHCRDCGAVVTV